MKFISSTTNFSTALPLYTLSHCACSCTMLALCISGDHFGSFFIFTHFHRWCGVALHFLKRIDSVASLSYKLLSYKNVGANSGVLKFSCGHTLCFLIMGIKYVFLSSMIALVPDLRLYFTAVCS